MSWLQLAKHWSRISPPNSIIATRFTIAGFVKPRGSSVIVLVCVRKLQRAFVDCWNSFSIDYVVCLDKHKVGYQLPRHKRTNLTDSSKKTWHILPINRQIWIPDTINRPQIFPCNQEVFCVIEITGEQRKLFHKLMALSCVLDDIFTSSTQLKY